MEIRIAPYPPYTSKYNPIEHRLFTHVTRACQRVIFTSVDLYHFHKKMLQLVEAHFAI
ncbi:ISAzo13-like element transposase-related protein [Tychonema sp. LEGE 07196]|uniref:ISAzo13-like element transposase-related protein n=1 Tax=Tychonema sp. LEGE 07196 TaxID=1828665 RepID=UPI0030D72541